MNIFDFASRANLVPRARDLQRKNLELWDNSGIIHNRKPEILAFLLDCYIPFCINNQSDSPRFMDYPRALDSFPEDRGLGVRDWSRATPLHSLPASNAVKSNMAANAEFQDLAASANAEIRHVFCFTLLTEKR